jgi:uncharacterized glyoxalase superfamily protein PhnB
MAVEAPSPIQVRLCVKGGAEPVAFDEKAFGAAVTCERQADDGIGLHDALPEFDGDVAAASPDSGPSLAIAINLQRPADGDAAVARAAQAGAMIAVALADMFWGARWAHGNRFGHVWAFNALLTPAA